jgi:peptidoglycan/xylan/chitin deacetylase (PgdA/CDA1 family)
MLKRLAKYVYAFYLFHAGLSKRVSDLKKQKAIIAIFDHDPTTKQFEKYIQWLLKSGFEFISLEQLIANLEGNNTIESAKIWFTLDDGWRNNLKLLAVIEKYQIPVTIFISTYAIETGFFRDKLEQDLSNELPTEFRENNKKLHDISNIERAEIDKPLYEKAKGMLPREALTVEELQSLSNHHLISIGLHTHTHPFLSQCTDTEIETEIKTNQTKLMEYTGVASNVLAIPYGQYNTRTIEFLLKSKLLYLATSDHGIMDHKTTAKILPRNGIAKASFYENYCRMLDFWYPNVEKINLFRKK